MKERLLFHQQTISLITDHDAPVNLKMHVKFFITIHVPRRN